MQDIHAIGGGGSRLFGGGDRRLRPHHQNQSLKCPRCDSLNTKFCYYNNYNLSQPRHFCKSCRRYWTKGGVLRNVPVGGGCRKTKRSKPKQSPETPRERKANSNSSSESSSLTATTPATATATATATTTTAAASGVTTDTGSASFNFPESRFFVPPQSTNPNFEHNASEGGVFPEIGSFTSLMTASTNDPTVLNFSGSDISPFRLNRHQQQNHEQQLRQNQQQWQLPKMTTTTTTNMNDEMTAGFLDQTVHVDLQLHRSSNGGGGGFVPLDWQAGGGDQGLFEFTGTVDQAYWNQNQWSSDHDHSLYLP